MVAMIEHVEAVENIDSILAVDGIDAYFMGPYDLSASMGVPGQLEHPKVLSAMRRVRQAGLQVGKPGGLHIVEPRPDLVHKSIKAGYSFIAYSLDIRMLDIGCRRGIAEIRSR